MDTGASPEQPRRWLTEAEARALALANPGDFAERHADVAFLAIEEARPALIARDAAERARAIASADAMCTDLIGIAEEIALSIGATDHERRRFILERVRAFAGRLDFLMDQAGGPGRA